MTDREKLEWAAKACEKTLQYCTVTDYKGKIVGQFITGWNPLTNQSDSDVMACKLRIPISFTNHYIYAAHQLGHSYSIPHNNTDEDVCRAVREARMLVAVEIGRAMP